MTDIRMLLHHAAPQPLGPLDMTALRARARRRSLRRFATWVAGVGAVITAAVPTGGAFLVNAAQGDRDQAAVEQDAGAVDATEIVDAADPAPMPGSAPSAPSIEGSNALVGSMGGVIGTTSTTSEEPSASSFYPRQSECVVDNADLGDGEIRTCRFTATARGGTEMTSSGTTDPPGATGEVTVTRNGVSTTYYPHMRRRRVGDASVFVGCSGGLIQPGDLVDMVLTNSTADPEHATITLSAGEGWSC
ncbi:MAG: hypothetical protein ACT452_17150 [Microthrixaceae bacterium]